jgi:hypothetical protein
MAQYLGYPHVINATVLNSLYAGGARAVHMWRFRALIAWC